MHKQKNGSGSSTMTDKIHWAIFLKLSLQVLKKFETVFSPVQS